MCFRFQLLDLQVEASQFKEEIITRDSRENIHRSALNLLVLLLRNQLHICIITHIPFQLLHSTHIVQHRTQPEEVLPFDPKKSQDALKAAKSDEYRVRPLHYTAPIEAAVGAFELQLRMLQWRAYAPKTHSHQRQLCWTPKPFWT